MQQYSSLMLVSKNVGISIEICIIAVAECHKLSFHDVLTLFLVLRKFIRSNMAPNPISKPLFHKSESTFCA